MRRVGGGGLIIAAILLIVVGWLIQSDLLAWLLDVIGWIFVIGGVILGVVGLISLFTGDRGRSSGF